MRKKVSKKKYETNAFTLYPKEYMGYVFLAVFLCILMLPGSILILVKMYSSWNELRPDEILVLLSLPIMSLVGSTYLSISIFKVCTKRIYLKIIDGKLIFNGILFSKCISISNIKTIRKLDGYRQLTTIAIFRRKDKELKESRKIRFPIIWFSDGDIRKLLRYFDKANQRIEWIDI